MKRLLFIILLTCASFGSAQDVVNVKESNFTKFLDSQDSSSGLLLEFYANWCPTCQHFAPEYEKVAHYFNAEPKVQPSVTVARTDCATEVKYRHKFCKLGHYIDTALRPCYSGIIFQGSSAGMPSLTLAFLQHPLCNSFKISRYPTLKYGLPTAFRAGSEIQLQEYVGQRMPTDIIQWIGQQKGV